MRSWDCHMYKLKPTREARDDVRNLAAYMINSLKNLQAATGFLKKYDQQIRSLTLFPYAYRGIGFEYHGYEIRMKTFSSYNILFTVDVENNQIIILRVLKDRQNWKFILGKEDEYSF